MAKSNPKLTLIDVQTASPFASADADGLDVYFPEEVRGWSDVLDCRVEPYTEQSIEELCAFAYHVHKKYLLVGEAHQEQDTPAAAS